MAHPIYYDFCPVSHEIGWIFGETAGVHAVVMFVVDSLHRRLRPLKLRKLQNADSV